MEIVEPSGVRLAFVRGEAWRKLCGAQDGPDIVPVAELVLRDSVGVDVLTVAPAR